MERDVAVTDRFEREMQRRREEGPRGVSLLRFRGLRRLRKGRAK
ncbi:hypothetical protein ACFYZ9_07285 [Streptomyces sp. NPDC001691]|nr:hypothetical protein [Streptomyces sp. SDr-06]